MNIVVGVSYSGGVSDGSLAYIVHVTALYGGILQNESNIEKKNNYH